MLIKTIPVGQLETNCYVITDEESLECAIVDPGDESNTILDYIEEKRAIIELLMRNSNASTFLDKLRGLIYKNCLEYAKKRFGMTDEAALDYFLSFASFGVMGMIKEWEGQGMTLSKDKLIAYADDLVDRSAQASF